MIFRKLGVALLAAAALAAIAVGYASAAATTTAAEWYMDSSPGTTLAGIKTFNLAIKKETTAVLESEVGFPAKKLKLVATGIECKGCTIENKELTSKAGKAAFGSGQINFTGVTVKEPANCALQSETSVAGQILSQILNLHADFMNGSTWVQQFIPAGGTTLARFKLVNGSGTCPVAGLYAIGGTLFADATNATGVFASQQQINISPTIETNDGGGEGALSIGVKSASLTTSIVESVFGELTAFGVR